MIRAIRDEFIPVSVPLPLLILPGRNDPESRLFQSVYEAREGAQGFGIATPGGKPLRWLPLLRNKEHFLEMLAEDRKRFAAEPDAPGPEPVPLPHAPGEVCPLNPPLPDGTVLADLIARAVDPQGAPSADLATQRGYSAQTFAVPFPVRAALATQMEKLARAPRVPLPAEFVELLLRFGYLGVEDFRPYQNPLARQSEVRKAELFAVRTDAPGVFRIEGETDLAAVGASSKGNPVGFHTHMRLTWEGRLEMEGQDLRSLLLVGRGAARLMHEGSVEDPELNRKLGMPIGTPTIDFRSDVRLGIEAPGRGRWLDLSAGPGVPTGSIVRRLRGIQRRMARINGPTVDLRHVLEVMETVEPLIWQGERQKVEAVLQQMENLLKRLEDGD